jgi:hypothetical protein
MEPPAKPPSSGGTAAGLGAACLVVTLFAGCLQPRSVTQQLVDGQALFNCVSSHWGEPPLQLAGECADGALAVVEDVIADIEMLLQKHTPDAGSSDAGAEAGAPAGADPYAGDPHVQALVAKKAAAHK